MPTATRLTSVPSMICRLVALVAVSACVWTADAAAQTFGRVEDRQSTSQAYFVHFRTGEATVVVSVWGTVQRPGTYEVGAGTDMGEVLSLAGGPLLAPLRQGAEIDVERVVRVRLYRQTEGDRALLYDAPLDEMVAAPDAYPVLVDGDVVEVQTHETETRHWTWRDTATIAGLAASGLIALSQFILIVR